MAGPGPVLKAMGALAALATALVAGLVAAAVVAAVAAEALAGAAARLLRAQSTATQANEPSPARSRWGRA